MRSCSDPGRVETLFAAIAAFAIAVAAAALETPDDAAHIPTVFLPTAPQARPSESLPLLPLMRMLHTPLPRSIHVRQSAPPPAQMKVSLLQFAATTACAAIDAVAWFQHGVQAWLKSAPPLVGLHRTHPAADRPRRKTLLVPRLMKRLLYQTRRILALE